jgi:hypothetical protein
MSLVSGAGYYIVTDLDQEKNGYYKISKTANITITMTQLNAARANRDFKLIKFFPVSDLKKAEDFIKSALKNKFIPNSTEWVKLDESALMKTQITIETLVDIVNQVD